MKPQFRQEDIDELGRSLKRGVKTREQVIEEGHRMSGSSRKAVSNWFKVSSSDGTTDLGKRSATTSRGARAPRYDELTLEQFTQLQAAQASGMTIPEALNLIGRNDVRRRTAKSWYDREADDGRTTTGNNVLKRIIEKSITAEH